MFGKINIHRHIKNAKNIFNHGYSQVKNIAHNVDSSVSLAKKVYSILAPQIQQIAGDKGFEKINKTMINRLTDYENIKNKVQHVEDNVANVVGNLQKNKINLGL